MYQILNNGCWIIGDDIDVYDLNDSWMDNERCICEYNLQILAEL